MARDGVFFKWSPKYNLNIKAIDDQHRELANILNRLSSAVTKRKGSTAIAGILDSLMGSTQAHFTLEESLMQHAQFDDCEAHKLEHDRLIEQLNQLGTRHFIEDTPIYFEMLSFLKTWLREHLLEEVRKFGVALQQGEFSVSAWEQEVSAEFALASNAKRPWWQFWTPA